MKVKTLRMPEKLEKILEEKAKEECRSFSAEVIKRVLDSLRREGIRCDSLGCGKEIKTVKPQLREQSGLRYRKTTHRN